MIDEQPRKLTPAEVDDAIAMTLVAHRTAGHFPVDANIDRARRMLTGEITLEEAIAEIDAFYGFEPDDEDADDDE